MLKVGLLGYGKAGQAVARVLAQDPRYSLQWVLRRHAAGEATVEGHPGIPVLAVPDAGLDAWLDAHPVDAVVDFSHADAVYGYGEALRKRGIMLVTAISGYTAEHQTYLQSLGRDIRVLCSPNITLGINFLLLAARLLRGMAPFADVEIVEQHFREKPEVSGTARKIAQTLELEEDKVTSLRVGGIVGHHEVIFGFPHQTVRLIHDAIRREAFGTGAAYALQELAHCPVGLYAFDDLMLDAIRKQLLATAPGAPNA
jgi:4-hydroxy-tetrahydrodipicolinate reductase